MPNSNFQVIASAYEKYKEAETNYKALAQSLILDMQERGKVTEETPYGKFTVAKGQTSYAFTKTVDALKNKLEEAKGREIRNGKAKVKTGKPHILVTLPKIEE